LAELTDRAPPQPGITEDSTTQGFGWVRVLWRGMAPLLSPHRGRLALIAGLMTVELGLQLAQRKAFSTMIDEAILKSNISLMVLILGLHLAADGVYAALWSQQQQRDTPS